ncbi:MAG: hypothetical protein K2N47_03225 [Clostridia bacterium]|nr:hypothetical protein [Clostridia bacterium]
MAESKVSALEGNELADDYVRTHLPKGRWSDTWQLFKSNFVRFVIINVFTLLFFVPGIAVVYIRQVYITQMGLTYPFAANYLFSSFLMPNVPGWAESITLSADLLFYSLLIVAGFIASIGIAGASYSIKKLINTHGQFTVKGYFHGIKVCYFNVLLPTTLFLVFVFGSFSISDWANLQVASNVAPAGPRTAQVFMIIATVVIGIIAMWLMAVGVSYKVKFKHWVKNTFVLLFGTILQSVLMLGFSLIPVWILVIGTAVPFFNVIGFIVFIFIGFSFILLSWLAYTQWVFDMFITPAVKTEEEARKANLSPKELAAEKEKEEKDAAREIFAAGRSELVGKPMRPIEGGTVVAEVGVAYGRADITRVEGDRAKIQSEVDEYYEQHKKDTKYVEYEKLFAERDKALSATDAKGKRKKLGNNLLRK